MPARTRPLLHHDQAIVLRTWPFHEADLLISLLTRESGVVKGVARHAMRSRRRFGGALEPGTEVLAHYAERPREDLMRLDSFDLLWSPLRAPVDRLRATGLQLVLEILEQALPEQAPEDNIYRLTRAALQAMEHYPLWLPVTYFCVWMCRLLGCLPELGHCTVCGLDLHPAPCFDLLPSIHSDPPSFSPALPGVWWSPLADGVTCHDDRRPQSHLLSPASIVDAHRIIRTPLPQLLAQQDWPPTRAADLRTFALALLERHLQHRLRSAATLP